MRIPGLKTAKKTSLWLKNKIFPGALILGYHRVVQGENDNFYLCTSPSHFEQQMEVLKQYANPISLSDLIGCLQEGEAPPKTVSVTIDDGYADALFNAKPVLEKYQVPATVFVTTGNLGGEFWWDQLERYVLSAPQNVGLLQLRIGDLILELDFSNQDSTKRIGQMTLLADYLRPLEETKRRQLLTVIREWSGSKDIGEQSLTRSMTSDELVSLNEGGLIQIGSHTVTHPVLSSLPEQNRRREIYQSKQDLEKILTKPVVGLSYPNGSYFKTDPELVSQAGYLYACASDYGTVRSMSNRFTLPRFWVKNINGELFHQWLKRWY
jgi:peptidoglycan/xylan/chitin deacetylase (PgdA/CDA1 family)